MAEHDTDSDVAVISQVQTQVRRPSMYAVVMHNDNYTTMEFVMYVLMDIFEHNAEQAYQLMMKVHQTGRAVVATLPFEIAEMKVEEVDLLAEEENYPLLTTIEPA